MAKARPEKLSTEIQIRVSPSDKLKYIRKAKRAHKPLAKWIRALMDKYDD